jgi:hypothetical protein
MDRGYSIKQFVGPFTPGLADQQVEQLFTSEFGSLCGYLVGTNAVSADIKGGFPNEIILWLIHRIQDKEYVKCLKDNSLHITVFNAGVEL